MKDIKPNYDCNNCAHPNCDGDIIYNRKTGERVGVKGYCIKTWIKPSIPIGKKA